MDFIKSFGFVDVDKAALLKLNGIIEVIVFNLLNNVLYVADALKVKTIKKAHLNGVVKILKMANEQCKSNNSSSNNNKKQQGGTVLPAEYFGFDSGRYFEDVDFHNTAYVDDFSRGALFVQEAGGRAKVVDHKVAVTVDEIKAIIEKFKVEMDASFKVASDIYPVIQQSVESNLTMLLLECSKNIKKSKSKSASASASTTILTAPLIDKSIKGAGATLSHLKYVWK